MLTHGNASEQEPRGAETAADPGPVINPLQPAAFKREAASHWLNVAADVELELAWGRLEAEADTVIRRARGQVWAVALGLSPDRGSLFEVLVYSPRPDFRKQAGALIVRALKQHGKAAA